MIYFLTDKDLGASSAVLQIEGPDANTYLQGQFTQDINVAIGKSVYGLWLDQKGRVLADGYVLKQADNDFIVISQSITAAALLARLEAYLIADEVTLDDQTDKWTSVLLWGDSVAHWSAPEKVLMLPSRRAGNDSVQLLIPNEQSAAVISGLMSASGEEQNFRAAELRRLRQACPSVPTDIGPRDLPNEGGLEEVAISYTKGCYLGQEVMARLKNLGQVRRRLHLVQGKGESPASGTALFQGEKKVGELRSTARDDNGFLGMAMLSLINLDPALDLALEPDRVATIKILRRV